LDVDATLDAPDRTLASSGVVDSNQMWDPTASLYLWPRLSECGSIDDVLLNIKMGAQTKRIIAEAGRSRSELVEGDMVGQANNMFWMLLN